MKHYQFLVKEFTRLHHFEHLSAMTEWDAAAMMPENGNQARANAMAELSLLTHGILVNPALEEAFEKVDEASLSSEQQASIREMKSTWQAENCLPADLVEKKSLAGAKCEHAWRTQRKEANWNGFAENLKPVLDMSREEAELRSKATGLSKYDALLDLYEPGMNTVQLDVIFNQVKSWLPELTRAVIEKQKSKSLVTPQGPFSQASQKDLGLGIMELLSFDFSRGRLDVSSHPFCGGVPEDVRITTRYSEDDFTQSLMGIIHETGHAKYEQGLPKEWLHLPVGSARSMGIHESQSLFMEMQVARSKAFLGCIHPQIQSHLGAGEGMDLANLETLYHWVKADYIRVDADEVTYPAHVILRYEIERDLIEGVIEVDDIPALWNQKMQEYLGVSTQDEFADGCMQDIHWTDGSFGYFPSYTLGAMYAAQFMASIRKIMDVDALIAKGDLAPIQAWLEQNIWSQASFYSTDELVRRATGESLNPDYFKQHLIARYLAD